jgi:hypothetical protein
MDSSGLRRSTEIAVLPYPSTTIMQVPWVRKTGTHSSRTQSTAALLLLDLGPREGEALWIPMDSYEFLRIPMDS